ncbi:hypothetical protein SPB21_10600 [Leptothoe sp. ISB3NOV94-8A]
MSHKLSIGFRRNDPIFYLPVGQAIFFQRLKTLAPLGDDVDFLRFDDNGSDTPQLFPD